MDKKICYEIINKFEQFEDSWDSYGAIPFNKEYLNCVRSFIERLEEDILQPFVCPTGASTIQLEWNINGKHLEIEIMEDKKTSRMVGQSYLGVKRERSERNQTEK